MSDDEPGYPPYGHIIRHLRMDLRSTSTEQLDCTMPVSDDIRDPGGAVRFGALSTMIDVAAGTFSHDLVRPDWLATSDMKVHLTRPSFADEVMSTTTSLRAGKKLVLSLNVVEDAHGEVARSWVTYVRLPRRDDSPTVERGGLTGRRLHYVEQEKDLPRPPLDDYIGLRARPGELTFDLEHQPQIHNSFGSIQGGVATTLVEQMAAVAGQQVLGAPCRVTDLHIYFIGQTRAGPFRVEGNVLRRDEQSVTVEVSVVDAGNDDRLLDLGTATASLIPDDQIND